MKLLLPCGGRADGERHSQLAENLRRGDRAAVEAEIGTRLRRSEDAVKVLLFRARQTLRSCLSSAAVPRLETRKRSPGDGLMTDEDLLQLLEEKDVEDLSFEEILRGAAGRTPQNCPN